MPTMTRERLAQLLADERREALEEAARACEAVAVLRGDDEHYACHDCAYTIRALIRTEGVKSIAQSPDER
jgi:hypothetical protein